MLTTLGLFVWIVGALLAFNFEKFRSGGVLVLTGLGIVTYSRFDLVTEFLSGEILPLSYFGLLVFMGGLMVAFGAERFGIGGSIAVFGLRISTYARFG